MGNTGERGSYVAHCATLQKPIRISPLKRISTFEGADIEMKDFSTNKVLDIEQQRKLYFLLLLENREID